MGVEPFGSLAVVDVSGLDFFAAQVAVLAAGALGWWVTRSVLLSRRARRGDRDRIAPGNLHPVELAYVTGGADHALLVAYVGLHERGELVPAPAPEPVAAADGEPGGGPVDDEDEMVDLATGWTVRAAGDVAGAHPVEQAVIDAVRNERQVPENLLALRLSHAMGSLHQRLAAQGLIVDARLARHVRLAGLWIAPTLLVALGGLFGAQGIGQDSLAYFGFALVAFGAACIGFWVLEVPRTTPAGTRMIAKAREPYPSPAAELGRDPRAVAALGPTLVWDVAPEVPASFGFRPPKVGERSTS